MALGYYDLSLYRNTRYALNIKLIEYFKDLLFSGDATRIIYSSTQYAFRERSKSDTPDLNTLNFPFLNFRINKVTNEKAGQAQRKLWKHFQNIEGIYISELQRKLRYTPVDIEYDCTLFYHRDDELQFGFDELTWDSSNENILRPAVLIDNIEIPFSAYINLNLDYEPEYNEVSALTQNRIHSISLNPTITTLILKDNNPGSSYCIPEKFILDFCTYYDIPTEQRQTQELFNYVINHFEETITPQ